MSRLKPVEVEKIVKAPSKLGFQIIRQLDSLIVMKHQDGRVIVVLGCANQQRRAGTHLGKDQMVSSRSKIVRQLIPAASRQQKGIRKKA